MPFQYKTPENASKRKKYTKTELETAIDEIKEGVSIRKISIKYDQNSQYKASQVFTIAEEKLLANYLLSCSKMHYGLTRKQAMQLAFEFATVNSKKFPDSWTTNHSAGKDWFRGFLCRNPELSLRTPEATSLSRATSFNKKNVKEFFTNLKTVLEKYKFEAHNIYNCDETGCTTVQNCPKVIANKKAKQVGQVTSAERGTTVTLCFAINAIGNVMPPFFIFPRVRYQEHFVSEGPEGSNGDAYPSGWMTTKSFVKYLEHFTKYSRASKTNRVLLILDNHESHVSIEAISFAKNNGITMFTLPPHCSNKLQPLDVSVYSSFKSRYNTAMNNWMLSHPGKTITIYNIPGFIRTIMFQAFTQSNILSGFQKTGIHPFNPGIFSEEDFLCSAVTDRDFPQEKASTNEEIFLERQIEGATELESEEIIASVYNYLKAEYKQLKSSIGASCDLSPLANILERTAAATGVSEQAVSAILDERKRSADEELDAGAAKRAKLSHDYGDGNVSPITDNESSCEAPDTEQDHVTEQDDNNEQTQASQEPEEPEVETLKVEIKEEEDDKPVDPLLIQMNETVSAVQHLIFSSNSNISNISIATDTNSAQVRQPPAVIVYPQSRSAVQRVMSQEPLSSLATVKIEPIDDAHYSSEVKTEHPPS